MPTSKYKGAKMYLYLLLKAIPINETFDSLFYLHVDRVRSFDLSFSIRTNAPETSVLELEDERYIYRNLEICCVRTLS